jgi:hypothetical protein
VRGTHPDERPSAANTADLWDATIPPELLELPELLARVDRGMTSGSRSGRAVLPRHGGTSLDPDGHLLAVDARQVPTDSVRAAGGRGGGLVDLTAVVRDPARRTGAASDHADEEHHRLRRRGGCPAQRRAARAGSRGQARVDTTVSELTSRTRSTGGCRPRPLHATARQSPRSRPPAAHGAPRSRDRSRAAGPRDR